MKKILLMTLLGLTLFSFKAYSHSGNTGSTECHTNYSTFKFHCHQKKQGNPYKTYYYIHYQG